MLLSSSCQNRGSKKLLGNFAIVRRVLLAGAMTITRVSRPKLFILLIESFSIYMLSLHY